MFHACAARFDVVGNLENFLELNKAYVSLNSAQALTFKANCFLSESAMHGIIALFTYSHATSNIQNC
jgi:hypothetical protein